MEKRKENPIWSKKLIECVAFFLMFVGLFLFPAYIRYPLLRGVMGRYAYINYLLCLAVLLLYLNKRDYSKSDLCMIGLWAMMLIPMMISNKNLPLGKTFAAVLNCWLPFFLILYKVQKDKLKKLICGFLLAFDCFIVILLLSAIIEKITNGMLLHTVVETMVAHGFECKELITYDSYSSRFFSVWGHPLTNAVLFNIFFIVNDIYYRYVDKKYPKIVFFLIALAGVLLCAGKTALVVLIVYLVFTNWQDKRWLLIYGAGIIIMYAIGAFDLVIQRFMGGSLTSGRIEMLTAYFDSGLYPFRFFYGYGTGTTYLEEMYHFKAAFEFPLMMYSLDYGMVFAVIMVAAIYIYASYTFLKRKQIVGWIGYSLLYAQINTYNGICLQSHDICWIMCTFTLIMINIARLNDEKTVETLCNCQTPVLKS